MSNVKTDIADSEASVRRLTTSIIALVVLLTIIRLWLAGHLELIEDEAYHWLLAREPALGYFDHAPMAAWWIAAGRWAFGDTEFAVRVLGVLSLVPATYFACRAHILLFGDIRRGLIGVIWLHATLFAAVGGIIISPDTPLVLFWTVAVFGLAKILRTGSGGWWYLVGASVGLALLSKYSAASLGIGIVLWLVLAPEMRRWFARHELYVGGLIAAVIFMPNLVWRYDNGWVPQMGLFDQPWRDEFTIRFVGDFIGGHLGLLTPVIFVFCAIAFAIAAWRGFVQRSPEWALIAALTVPTVSVLLAYSFYDRVQANWTAMLIPLLVVAGVEIGFEDRDRGFWRALRLSSLRFAAPIGYFVCAFVYAQAIFDLVPDRGIKDPTSRTKGWQALAGEVEAIAAVQGVAFIATTNFGLNALLTFYVKEALPVVQVTERQRYMNLGAPPLNVYGQPGLYLVRARKDARKLMRGLFGFVERIGELERRRPGGIVEVLNIYRLREPKAVPPFTDAWL